MFKIPKIENSEFYIDKAIKSMEEIAPKKRDEIDKRFAASKLVKEKDQSLINLDKRKDLELEKIRYLNESVKRKLKKIISCFPKFEKLDKVYLDLINTSNTPVNEIKNSLQRINFIIIKTDEFTQNTEWKIKKAKSQKTIGFLMGKYLGKVNSLFRKEKKNFEILDEFRKFANKLPKFENLFTVGIGGYPNVGKSTLMKKISGSDVEIQNYPFTTKGLMFSYLYLNDKKAIQLIDTPGLLGRKKENNIEKRASLILHNYAEKIIFVIDFTESCGYSIEEQLKLLKKISSETNKEIIIYLSKTDIYDDHSIELKEENMEKLKKYKMFEESEKLKDFLIENYKKSISKFDPSKIETIK
jgi:nucleolar GTP-binding protein